MNKGHSIFSAVFFFLFYLGCINVSNGQIDQSSGSNYGYSINAPNAPISPNESINFINPKDEEQQFEVALQKRMQKQIEAQELKDLNNKGIISREELYKKRLKAEMDALQTTYAKIDQDLGGFSTSSKTVTIVCRDFAYPDGDMITIFLNDSEAIRFIELTQSYQQFTLPLTPGLNTIAFKALNQGSSGPNTAGFMIFDDSGNILSSNEWNLATGAKAVLSIARDY